MKTVNYFGNPRIGLFIATNNEYTCVPPDCPQPLEEKLEETLKTKVVKTTIGESVLLGLYSIMNSKGIVLPNIVTQKVIEIYKRLGLNVCISEDKHNAIGNNIVITDKKGIINKEIGGSERKKIEDALGIELVEQKIAQYLTVGSCCVATNRGFLAHFKTTQEEIEEIKRSLEIDGGRGTINNGVGFVSVGLVANDNGYIAGEQSTAYELGRVVEALGFL